MIKLCIIIPVFNHGKLLEVNIDKLLVLNIPLILVNDGSNQETSEILTKIAAKNPQIILHDFAKNQGKGAAVKFGFSIASANGFTNALQFDADGQHQISDIHKFVELAQNNPEALINGTPIYDKSSSKLRLFGKKITNFWVMLETFSFNIPDAMCGFRVYPLAKTLEIFNKHNVSKRMGFDIEIIVLLYWNNVEIINQPTLVIYPSNGTSNFRMLRDNLQISLLHAKLFFGMFGRITSLIKRKK